MSQILSVKIGKKFAVENSEFFYILSTNYYISQPNGQKYYLLVRFSKDMRRKGAVHQIYNYSSNTWLTSKNNCLLGGNLLISTDIRCILQEALKIEINELKIKEE